VKAKDDNGSEETSWSTPLAIHIAGGPQLEIDRIKGGLFKVHTVIKNIGDLKAENVSWNITLDGGSLLLNGENSGIIADIPAGGEVDISSNLILGFGKTRVKVTAEILNGLSDTREQNARVILFFIKVNIGGG